MKAFRITNSSYDVLFLYFLKARPEDCYLADHGPFPAAKTERIKKSTPTIAASLCDVRARSSPNNDFTYQTTDIPLLLVYT